MRTLIALATLLASTPAAADPVDDWVAKTMADYAIPGMAIGLFCKGEPLRYGTYGYANLEHEVPVTLDTRFQTASVAKQFTAALIQILARDGALGLDDPISRYIDDTPEAWAPITIRHLLTHTSGIPDYEDDFSFRRDWTEEELIKAFLKSDLAFTPGTEWSYSNSGYVMLGAIVRKVTGTYWGDVAKERIFTPAGMTTAAIIDVTGIVPHRAAGYHYKDGKYRNGFWVAPSLNTTADGSVHATILDMAAWEASLAYRTILTEAELREAWTPATDPDGKSLDYGLGWFRRTFESRDQAWHDGSWQGFNTMLHRDLTGGMTVVFLANRDGLPVDAMSQELQRAAREAYETQGAAACAD